MASPVSPVPADPPRSLVRRPASMAFRTAASTASASLGSCSEYRNIMATDKMVPMGFAMPWPEMSGAEPGWGAGQHTCLVPVRTCLIQGWGEGARERAGGKEKGGKERWFREEEVKLPKKAHRG